MLTSLLLGAAIGLILAFSGAGGGILAVPLLMFTYHLPIQQAAPIGLIATCASASVGALIGLKQGIVRYRAVLWIGSFGLIFAPVGIWLAHQISPKPLAIFFSLVMAIAGIRMLRQSSALMTDDQARTVVCPVSPEDNRISWSRPCARILAMVGTVMGLLSGLLGVGGGFLLIPALLKFTTIPFRSIQATTLAVTAIITASGVGAAILNNHINWQIALPFCIAAVATMLIGLVIAKRIHIAVLQRFFAVLCIVVAAILLIKQLI